MRNVKAHLLKYADECIDGFMDDATKCWTESPIEAQFLTAFYFQQLLSERPVFVDQNGLFKKRGVAGFGWAAPYTTIIVPQTSVGNYRADFLIFRTMQSGMPVIVECDGHDFHERTKAQAKRDRARDREMTIAGYRVLRFTGSEIFTNPFKCAEQVCEFLSNLEEVA